jgi:hypothetical protein
LEYYLDGLLIGINNNLNFKPTLNNIASGSHIITSLAYAADDSHGSDQVSLRVNNSNYNSSQLSVAWLNSIVNQTFQIGTTIQAAFSVSCPKPASSLKIYLRSPDEQENTVATSFGDQIFNNVIIHWNKTQQAGEYTLWFETDSGVKSDNFNFTVE